MTTINTTVPDAGVASPPSTDTRADVTSIPAVRELQAQRIATIKSRLRIDNQARALVRRCLGYQTEMDEAATAKVCALAAKIVKAIQKNETVDGEEEVAKVCGPFVLRAHAARSHFDSFQKELERDMTKQAKLLPVWPWAEAINGFGALGLAIIVGECGDLSNYANPAKLWKRMGLAVMGGNRQGNPGKEATNEDWIKHGYSPRRRSAVWTIGDSLLKKQNEYRDLYMERKRVECDKAAADGLTVVSTSKETVSRWTEAGLPEPVYVKKIDKAAHRTVGHITKRAQRYAEKRLLRDLWRAWRDT